MMIFASILVRPVIPLSILIPVLLVTAGMIWHTYRHCALSSRQRLTLWLSRMSAITIIAWLLLQAERRNVHYQVEAPVLAVALDVSASMQDSPRGVSPTRSKRALGFVTDRRIAKLCKRYRVFKYEIGAEAEERTQSGEAITFNAPRSHITSGINQICERLHAENLAAVLLLSDGLDHSGASLAPEALGVPTFVPELEEPTPPKEASEADAWVAEVSYPRMMVVNWKASVDVLVRRDGTGSTSFPIHFRQGSRALRTSMVKFEDGEQFKQVSFSVEPLEVGQILYQIEITPKTDGDPENNTRDFLIDVSDPKNRVLYLEGPPRWEFKFLKRALLSEKNYQLSAFVRGGDGNFISFDEASGFASGEPPTFTAEELRSYKVIVLGDLPGTALKEEQWRGVRDFVDKGGGLLFIGAANAYGRGGLQGAPYIEELLPAQSSPTAKMNEGKFSVDLTATGRAHPALSGLPHETRLPPVLSFWTPVKASTFSSALIATADGSPILLARRYGQGRVAMVLSDSLWRWQLGGMDTSTEKSLYNRFVTQLIYWLAPSAKEVEKSAFLQLVTEKSEFETRERITIGAVYDGNEETPNESLSCRVTTPDKRRLVFPMVRTNLGSEVGIRSRVDGFKCVFTPQTPGKYQVTVATPDGTQEESLILLVAEPEHEKTGAPLNRGFLQDLAGNTGGRFVQWKDRYKMFKHIQYRPKEVEIVEEYPIWNNYFWLALLIGLFTAEWWWRRRLDLV